MKNSIKILSLCFVMMCMFTSISMGKTSSDSSKIINEHAKIANYLKNKKFVDGDIAKATQAYNDALAAYTMAVALDAMGSNAQTKALLEANRKALESSLGNLMAVGKGDGAFTKIVLGVLDALKGIFKINVTVEDKRSKTITDPIKPVSFEIIGSEVSPFDPDWGN